jgi:hypothetical protein
MTDVKVVAEGNYQVAAKPRYVFVNTDADNATITAAGWLNSVTNEHIMASDIIVTNYASNAKAFYNPSIDSAGVITLSAISNPGEVSLIGTAVNGNVVMFSGTTGDITDAGFAAANVMLNNAAQTVTVANTSATPGTVRSLVGKMNSTVATQTSGNLVGVRGEVNCVSASGGFLYGAQGKIIATGTLSGSSWSAGVFGQLDISAATVNAGQMAPLWGDYGSTSGTMTNTTGLRGVVMTNTTAAVLNAQDYRYGNATYLLELAGAGGTLNYYANAGTSAGSAGDAAHCAAQKVIAVQINGVAAYIPVFTQNS